MGEATVSEALERAHETMEHHEHGHGHDAPAPDLWSRRVAVLISALAAALALTEVGAKSSQTEYLTRHIAVSDDWAYYQAKNLRAAMRETEAHVLASLPNAGDASLQTRIKDANDYGARMRDDPQSGDGMKQIAEKTRALETERNEAFHRYHSFEYAAGALEIAIVLASVSVVTRMRPLAIGSAVIGLIAAIGSVCVALNVI